MRSYLVAVAATATVVFSLSLTLGANAMPPVGGAAGVQLGLDEMNWIEQVRRVCRLDRSTNRRVCWVDRSQPPTVCHWVRDRRGNLVRDCY